MISHGSEGEDVEVVSKAELHIKVISHGSEGMDIRSVVQI